MTEIGEVCGTYPGKFHGVDDEGVNLVGALAR